MLLVRVYHDILASGLQEAGLARNEILTQRIDRVNALTLSFMA
jgi:hypothetical protein